MKYERKRNWVAGMIRRKRLGGDGCSRDGQEEGLTEWTIGKLNGKEEGCPSSGEEGRQGWSWVGPGI